MCLINLIRGFVMKKGTEKQEYLTNVSHVKRNISALKKEVISNTVLNSGTKQAIDKALIEHESTIMNNGVLSARVLNVVNQSVQELSHLIGEEVDNVISGKKEIEDVYAVIEDYNKNELPRVSKNVKTANLASIMD